MKKKQSPQLNGEMEKPMQSKLNQLLLELETHGQLDAETN